LDVPLVIHGGSGLPEWMVEKCVDLGVRKFNVNTEIRVAYIERVMELTAHAETELTVLISDSINAMRDVISKKIKQFGGLTS
jgi:tagatose 1,6-diphosphate aldolase GatY/KbaY